MVNDDETGDQFLSASPEAAKRIALFKQSMLDTIASGDILNTNDEFTKISNERLVRNPLLAYFKTQGGMNDKNIATVRSILEKGNKRQFSDDEIRKLINLEGGVADFRHMDDNKIAVGRSPAAYGTMVVGENFAKTLLPLYKALGLDTVGISLNDTDMTTLSGADLDGDEGKVIRGLIVGSIEKTIENYRANMAKGQEYEVKEKSGFAGTPGGEKMNNTEAIMLQVARSMQAPLEMGFFSGVGSRASQLDLNDPTLNALARTSYAANKGYDKVSTYVKNPVDVLKDKKFWSVLGMGQE